MGDISELRGLVLVVSFLGLLVMLIGLTPPQFYYVAGEQSEFFVPDEWAGIDLQAFKETWNATNLYSYFEQFAIGGRNLQWNSEFAIWDNMLVFQRYGFGLLWYEAGTWYNRKNMIVSYIDTYPAEQYQEIGSDVLDTDYETYDSVEFTIKFAQNSPFQLQAYFTFNETAYTSPSHAWQNDNLSVLLGIDFDNINTAYNAWDLIAMLLFFNLPNTHWAINAIIAIPIWVTVAYLAYVLIIKVIPLIAGG